MSKELIYPDQFAHADVMQQDLNLSLNKEQEKELFELYESAKGQFKAGNLLEGAIVKIDSDGILVDIDYKSDGLIPKYVCQNRGKESNIYNTSYRGFCNIHRLSSTHFPDIKWGNK